MTLSNVAVASRVVSWLDTASPTYTAASIVNVSVPTIVHARPSADREVVNLGRSRERQSRAFKPAVVLDDVTAHGEALVADRLAPFPEEEGAHVTGFFHTETAAHSHPPNDGDEPAHRAVQAVTIS